MVQDRARGAYGLTIERRREVQDARLQRRRSGSESDPNKAREAMHAPDEVNNESGVDL